MISVLCWIFNRDVAGKVEEKMQVVTNIGSSGAERNQVGPLYFFRHFLDKDRSQAAACYSGAYLTNADRYVKFAHNPLEVMRHAQ